MVRISTRSFGDVVLNDTLAVFTDIKLTHKSFFLMIQDIVIVILKIR